jgi:hypothetical protein
MRKTALAGCVAEMIRVKAVREIVFVAHLDGKSRRIRRLWPTNHLFQLHLMTIPSSGRW